MILRCQCVSAYQDAMYGSSMRVHNRTKKSEGAVYRCTVCGDEKYGTTPPASGQKSGGKKTKSKVDSGKKAKK